MSNKPLFIGALIFLLVIGSAQAYFISPNVPLDPSGVGVIYFLGDYVSNETLIYSDRIYLDGTWIVMVPDNYFVNVTVMKINSSFQHFMLQNSTGDINLSINTSGWSISVSAEVFANDTSVLNITSNSSGWINFLFQDFLGNTTNLTISAEAIAQVLLKWVVYPLITLPSTVIRLVVEITNQETNITSSFSAELNSTPSITFPFDAYNQTQSIASLEAYNLTNITWIVAVPHNETTLNLTGIASGIGLTTASSSILINVKEKTVPPLSSSTPGGSWYDTSEDTITIVNTCLDDDNLPQTGATSNVTIIMPNGTIWLDSVWMSENYTGYFTAERAISTLSGLRGDYLVRTSCNTSSEWAHSNMRAFHLKGVGNIVWTSETRNLTNDTTTIAEINSTIWGIKEALDLNWTQLWNYFNCTNVTSDLNDICFHLDTIISDISDVGDDISDIEEEVEEISKDTRKIRIQTQPKVDGWIPIGNFIMQHRYYFIAGIGMIVFLVIVWGLRKVRKASNEQEGREEEGLGPEEEYG